MSLPRLVSKLRFPALLAVFLGSLKKRLSVLAQWALFRALWRDPVIAQSMDQRRSLEQNVHFGL
ncbi:hypothetical protein SynSYN20_01040 [Synechococcus sp. SYN20]|nr:hypothetical protein SynSYN20_01040 [Synechococcus sp. SYN20]